MRRLVPLILIAALLAIPGKSAAAQLVDPAVAARWDRDDGGLANGEAQHTWTWGPLIERYGAEPYAEAPGGQRTVWYLDKARMEITQPDAERDNDWFVTSGLLVRELIGGEMQMGDGQYEARAAAAVPVAGDLNTPITQTITYADLAPLASLHTDQRAPSRLGDSAPISATLAPGGAVGSDAALAAWNVQFGAYDDVLGHNEPDVWGRTFTPADLLYIAGHPLTEPYWVTVPVNNTPQQVLLQAFERRVLTYTPNNAPEWQVEWGNVGRQYAQWRYGTAEAGQAINPNTINAVQPRALRDLSNLAANIAQERQGVVGVAVYRLDTDEFWSFQGTRPFEMYSTAKVPIMLAVLDRAARENRRVTDNEQALIRSMIQRSDNNAATSLIISVGGAQAVDAFLRRNRINDTHMNTYAWGASTTTAQDMARLMARLGNCMMLNQRLCNYALQTMRGVIPGQDWGVSAGTAGASVALKNGWYPDAEGWGVNSVGLITSANKQYAIAVYTYPDPSFGYGVSTIEQISTAIYPAIK